MIDYCILIPYILRQRSNSEAVISMEIEFKPPDFPEHWLVAEFRKPCHVPEIQTDYTHFRNQTALIWLWHERACAAVKAKKSALPLATVKGNNKSIAFRP